MPSTSADPPTRDTAPPNDAADVVSPLLNIKLPPTPDVPEPTSTDTLPPRPLVDVPVPTDTHPLLPDTL
jgi:hypothetical protein